MSVGLKTPVPSQSFIIRHGSTSILGTNQFLVQEIPSQQRQRGSSNNSNTNQKLLTNINASKISSRLEQTRALVNQRSVSMDLRVGSQAMPENFDNYFSSNTIDHEEFNFSKRKTNTVSASKLSTTQSNRQLIGGDYTLQHQYITSNKVSNQSRKRYNSQKPTINLTGQQFDSPIKISMIPGQDDEFKSELIQKILNKRLKKAAGHLPQHPYNKIPRINQKTTVLTEHTSDKETQELVGQSSDEELSDDPLNPHENNRQDSIQYKLQKTSNKERKIRIKDQQDFIRSQKQKERPRLTNKQAEEKIQYYMLATEKRAQDRQQLLLQRQLEAELIQAQVKLAPYDPVSQSEENDSFSESASTIQGLQIIDSNNKKFKFKLPRPDSGEQEVHDTMHSFYSSGNQTKTKFRKPILMKQNIVITEDLNEDTKSVGSPSPRAERGEVTQKNSTELLDFKAEEEAVEVAKMDLQEEQDPLQNKETLLREQEEQLELLGDSFLMEIHKMIQVFDPDTKSLNNNGNVQSEGLSSLASSQRSIREKQVLDTVVVRRQLKDFEMMLRKQAAFFKKSSQVTKPIFFETSEYDEKISYFNECLRNQVLCFPYLNRVHNQSLVLQNKILNFGICSAFKSVMGLVPSLLKSLVLDCNGMNGQQMQAILEGLCKQSGQFKSLTVQDNEIDDKSVDFISQLCARKAPDQLDHLHLYFCKMPWQQSEKLLKNLRYHSALKSLSLVKVTLNEFSLPHLENILRSSKRLTKLDLSWSQILPKTMRKLLLVISESRRLQFINLSWNNLCDGKTTEKDQLEICSSLGQLIKHNKQLIHFDLTSMGLTSLIIKELGTHLRRARSLLGIHLSGNPGLTEENQGALCERVRCRPNEDIERFTRIQNMVYEHTNQLPEQYQQGIIRRITQLTEFKKRESETYERFILQRMIGFRAEQLGAAQWYESSANAVPIKKHYKSDCWICERHVYSVLFWSRGRAFQLTPIFPETDAQRIRYQIDFVPLENIGKPQEPGLGHVNGNFPYHDLEDRVPYITGSFTGWRYKKMTPLHEFTKYLDKDFKEPLEIAYFDNRIKRQVSSVDSLTEVELGHYKVVCAMERRKYRVQWARYFKRWLTYKETYLINAEVYNSIDDELDVLDGDYQEPVHLDVETESQYQVVEQSQQEPDSLATPYLLSARSQTYSRSSQKSSEYRQEPVRQLQKKQVEETIPVPPDESKWDIVYVLPFFAKPGKHTYMVKYKNTQEKVQAGLIERENVLIELQHKAQTEVEQLNSEQELKQVIGDLKPEIFFYQTNVIQRSEPVPNIVKPRISKVVQRSFNKDTSVFKNWYPETAAKKRESIETDALLWKLHKFMNKAGESFEIENCKNLILKHSDLLKEVFISLVAVSSYPAITLNDLSAFVQLTKIVEPSFAQSVVDRLFISANFQPAENPKFMIIGNALVRFELWELLVRISDFKYKQTGQVQTYSQALEKLILEKIKPFAQPEPWQSFRDNQLWTIDVNDILEANLTNLRRIYERFTSVKKYLNLEDIQAIFAQMENSDNDLRFCFALSKMVVTNEALDYKKYNMLLFPEFMEFMGRLGDLRYRNTEDSSQPLAWKIEQILEDLCPMFGLKKIDVNLNIEDNSESDDDY